MYIKGMNFCREVNAARLRIRSIARDIKTHQQQGEEVVSAGDFKIIFRSTRAVQPDSIRIQLGDNKAVTLRLDNGRVRITNLTMAGPKALQARVNVWIPSDEVLDAFDNDETKRVWRSFTAGPDIVKLLTTLLTVPRHAAKAMS